MQMAARTNTMDFLKFFNDNPALLSVIAFPLGLILTLAIAQKYIFTGLSAKVETWFNAYLEGYRKHTEAEVKIEERLRQLVDKMEEMLTQNWDTKRFFDSRIDGVTDRIDGVSDRLDSMNQKIDVLIKVFPKRRSDKTEDTTEGNYENRKDYRNQ